jgi:hypothetical protein
MICKTEEGGAPIALKNLFKMKKKCKSWKLLKVRRLK